MADQPPQMQGQILDTAFTTAANALPYAAPAPWIDPSRRSAFVAAYIETYMQDQIASKIKRTHSHQEERIIAMGWQSGTPEPPPPLRKGAKNTEVQLLGAADNRIGLQILMFSINGQTMRKDGIPYHAIWSVDGMRTPILKQDDDHTWPHKEIVDVYKQGSRLTDQFIFHTSLEKTHRILTDVEMEAEVLALACYKTAMAGNDVITPDYDYLARAMDLKFPDMTWRPFRLITFESNGTRRAQDVDLRV